MTLKLDLLKNCADFRTNINDRVRFRVLGPLVVSICLLLGVFYIGFYRTHAEGIREVRQVTEERARDLLKLEMGDEVEEMSAALEAILNDEALQKALQARDRNALISRATPLYEKLRSLDEITHFYFDDPHRVNIVRLHKLETSGDTIDRISTLEAERTGKPSSALEQGVTGGCTLRVVYPWFVAGKLIGFVELGKEFKNIASEIHNVLDVNTVIVVDKKILNRKQWEHHKAEAHILTDWDEFQDVVVIDQSTPVIPMQVRQVLNQPREREATATVTATNGTVSELIFLPLDGPGQLNLGHLVVYYDVKDASWGVVVTITLACVGIGALLMIGFYVFLGRVERDLGQRAARLVDANLELTKEISVRETVQNARLQAESALLESNRKLKDALMTLQSTQNQVIQQERMRALGEMASGIAHDFNNALTSVLGYSELLLATPQALDDKVKLKKYLSTINTAAGDAAKVVGRLREFYRPRDEHEVLTPVNLNAVLEQVISLTQPRWKNQALLRGVTIDVQRELNDVPKINGDESQLREAFMNMVLNAVDAMPHSGKIVLRTRTEGPWVIAEVSDTGTGMTDEVRRRCLEPFFTTKGARGTGLGMSMVFGIVERHEGKIEIESKVGEGTTFRILLPVMKQLPLSGARIAVSAPHANLRVLVVDDEASVREVLTEYLLSMGHTVKCASSGSEGLELFQAGEFDVVITDRAMPDMNGDQVAAAIKILAPSVPVILLTGFGGLMNAWNEVPDGVSLVIGKPIRIAVLHAALEKATQRVVSKTSSSVLPAVLPAVG